MSSLSPYQPDDSGGQRRLELYRQIAEEQVARTSGYEARRAAYAARVQMETIWALVNIVVDEAPPLEDRISQKTRPGSAAELTCQRAMAVAGLSAEALIARQPRG